MTIIILQEAPLHHNDNYFQISRLELVKALRASNVCLSSNRQNQQVNFLKSFILKKTHFMQIPQDVDEKLLASLVVFSKYITKCFRKCHRIFHKFVEIHSDYLSDNIDLPVELKLLSEPNVEEEEDLIPPTPPIASEHKRQKLDHKKPFCQLSRSVKYRESQLIRTLHDNDALFFTAKLLPGKLASLIKLADTPTGMTLDMMLGVKEKVELVKRTPQQALSFLLNNELSKSQYQALINTSKNCNADIFPSYKSVAGMKKFCRPDNIVAEDLEVVVPLQKLLDHTAKRILSDHPVLSEMVEKNPNERFELLMIYKYGFDGCGSFQTYMQRDESGWVPQDASTIIFTQMVPLRIVKRDDLKFIVYNNYSPNSAHSYRPVRIANEPENNDNIFAEGGVLTMKSVF